MSPVQKNLTFAVLGILVIGGVYIGVNNVNPASIDTNVTSEKIKTTPNSSEPEPKTESIAIATPTQIPTSTSNTPVTMAKPEQAAKSEDVGQKPLPGDSVQTDAKSKYHFPGILPASQITNKKVVIKTEKGTITLELYPTDAPKTVSNFVYLANQKFYNGLKFHRYEPGFVIQGGDPKGNGTGGPGYKFVDEKVTRKYDKGILAMANSGPDTNGSQFFIMLENTPLPPLYTIFGKVTSGLDVVDQIRAGDVMQSVTIK